MDKKAGSDELEKVVIRNVKGSVNTLHSFLREQDNTSESCLIIDESCSITQHQSDFVKYEPEIRFKQLIVNSNMSSQSLQALLAPLAVGNVMLQQCRILDEGKENNEFTVPFEVLLVYNQNISSFFSNVASVYNFYCILLMICILPNIF